MTEWTVINETYTNDGRGPWREYLVEGPMRPDGFAAPQLIVSVPERSSVPGFRRALHGQGMPGVPSDDEMAAARAAVEAFRGALQRAADYLGATQLPDGRWAYFARETGRWYRLSAEDLAYLVRYLDHADPDVRRDAYSRWCSDTPAEEMPEAPAEE